MSCKYKYKDNWYSKDEIKKILLKERGINSKGELIKPTITNNPKQAKITKENTTSIESVKNNILGINKRKVKLSDLKEGVGYKYDDSLNSLTIKNGKYQLHNYITGSLVKELSIKEAEEILPLISEKEFQDNPPNKEYTQQALTNLKVAALKEVARKYPRSLITSKVVPINPNMVDNSEIQYSKVGSKQDIEGFKEFISQVVDSGIDTNRKIEIPYFRTNRKKGDVEILPNSEGYFAESQFGKGYYISLDKPYIDHSYFEGKILKQGVLSINPNEVIDLSELIIPTSDKKEKDIKDIFENGDRNTPLDKRFLDKGYKAVIRVVDGRALEMIIYDLNLANKLIKEQQEFKGYIEDFYKGGKYYNPNYSKNKLPEGIEKLQENFIKEYGKEAFQEFLDNYKSFDDNLTLIHKDIFGIRQELKPNVVDSNKKIEEEIALKDGKSYNKQEINTKMLEEMGYSPMEIGKLLKEICG